MKKLLLVFLPFILFTVAVLGVDQANQFGLPCAITVTKSDTTLYVPPLRALFFNATAAQTLTVDMAGPASTTTQSNILFTYAVAGTYLLPISVSKVKSTGTSVTGIVGLRECTATSQPTATSTPTPTATFTPTPTP